MPFTPNRPFALRFTLHASAAMLFLFQPVTTLAADGFSTSATPGWVKPVTTPSVGDFPKAQVQNGVYYLLVDKQVIADDDVEPV